MTPLCSQPVPLPNFKIKIAKIFLVDYSIAGDNISNQMIQPFELRTDATHRVTKIRYQDQNFFVPSSTSAISTRMGSILLARAGQVALICEPFGNLTPPSHQNHPPEMIPTTS